MRASPFVKWAGGKGQLLSQYDPFFPRGFSAYIEPFVGGGAVFFHLLGRGLLAGKQVVLIDSLEELINCYRTIQGNVERLIAELRRHEPHKLDADYFYTVRDWDRQSGYLDRSPAERAGRFIFLNHTCYNGLYRVNRRGQFNVPFGRYDNPKVCDAANLRAVSRALQGVIILEGDFSRCLELAKPGDLIYLDPPYHPLPGAASFTGYTREDFATEDQKRLATVFRGLDRRGCRLMLSNSYTELVRELYAGGEQVVIQGRRSINSRADGRGDIRELLIINRHHRATQQEQPPKPRRRESESVSV